MVIHLVATPLNVIIYILIFFSRGCKLGKNRLLCPLVALDLPASSSKMIVALVVCLDPALLLIENGCVWWNDEMILLATLGNSRFDVV